ncbi:hypothetical protein GGF46_005378 [Coemansia sp. RSA 552]|nr:hypothetical protein GGF46_005378 [Coemansia sp. RSA 552]
MYASIQQSALRCQVRFAPRLYRSLGTQPPKGGYEEAAKRELREYQHWRKHFTWRQGTIKTMLREYALWSSLALMAYYNMTKRHETQDYVAESFVEIDRLEERVHQLDASNPLLHNTIWEQPPEPPAAPQDSTANDGNSVFF